MLPSNLKFNNIKLRNKLLILYILCVFLPIVFTNIVFYHVTSTDIKNQKMEDVELVLDQITNDFVSVIEQAIGISTGFYTDYRLYEFFETDYETPIDYIEAYDYYLRELNRFSPLFYSIMSISFYTTNPNILYAGGVQRITEETEETEWYQMLSNTNNPIVLRTNPHVESEMFSLIRELDFFRSKNETRKIIKIDINPHNIRQSFNNVTFQGNVYLLNAEGNIEYSTDSSIDWRRNNISYQSLEFKEDTIVLEDRLLPKTYFDGWKIVGTISEREILEELYQSGKFIIVLASINFLLPTIIIILISRSIHTRILRVLKHMRKMKKQNFETIPSSGDKDEIGELTSEFNKMSRTINKLINEVYIANIEKKDLELKEKQAQLSALQSQINPHFLFNALETIRMRSVIKGEKETAKIIQNMAKIFRNSLTWGKEWVTVQEEMNLIICFLEIQKYRFGDKLEYELEVDTNVNNFIIPNMAFLPFVENASIHGIEPVKENGKIHLKIHLENDHVVYTIRDNGAGMSKEKRERLMESLLKEESMGESVGIKNVYYRLKLYFKEDFQFTIDSSPGEGTIVQIKLPSGKNYKN
ncbi:sensor histidine kinase [Evansella sp. AB-rgal1]|uniref:sensor histidine kinase n=1 Tax=Evansella sp. AB-rgal1 TaxID=3242696 RepID=UPI00359D3BBF